MLKSLHKYFRITKDTLPSNSLLKAIKLLGKKGQALDLGCGAGRDTKLLLEKGLFVTAVDKSPFVRKYLIKLPYQDRLKEIVIGKIEDFQFGRYDLINAQWVLHFIAPKNFNEAFNRIKNSLNLGGILVGTLLGFKDEWNIPKSEKNFHSRNEVKKLLKGFEILELKEENKNGSLVSGASKHWHIFHFIAKK